MALTGIQIYKLLPQTNCKDCGFPTCLAFAMKLAAKQIELSSCPHVNDAAKAQLAESSEPPVHLISVKSNGYDVQAGNEVVLFRHEKTFYHKPGVFLRVRDDESAEAIKAEITRAAGFQVNYVGRDLVLDGFAVEAVTGDVNKFTAAIAAVRDVTHRPI
ncbi:partial 4Fe-4S ferredoxin, partial [Anaerolineae bacterium]